MSVAQFLELAAQQTEAALERYIAGWGSVSPPLDEAIRYSLFAGGKRLRPALVLGAAELAGGHPAEALPAACALELIHTYSLIHDDLPSMDDDDLRRGKPSLHKVYGEAMAILAGDALLTMAFDVAASGGRIDVIREIAQAAGVAGMAGGQVLDLKAEGRSPDLDGLRAIHRAKTGALIRCAVRCGGLIGGSGAAELESLTAYGDALGLAFQIADDILDVTGEEESLGKRTGGDASRAKATYPSVVGLEKARVLAHEAERSAVEALAGFGAEADTFRALARYVVERRQ